MYQSRFGPEEHRYTLQRLFTKILTFFRTGLNAALPKSGNTRRDALLSLFSDIKALDALITDLIEIISLLEKDWEQADMANDRLRETLSKVVKCLSEISSHLEFLAPGFEIMAEVQSALIADFYNWDSLLVWRLGLIRVHGWSENNVYEPLADYKERLNEVRQKGELARKSLADFIRQEYTWATLGDEPNLSNVVLPPPVIMNNEKFVHVAILTIREDEYEGVRTRLSESHIRSYGTNQYLVSDESTGSGQTVTVALAKLVGAQGDLEAQRITTQIIADLHPTWIIVSGIAGAMPDDSFSLFDVIVSTGVYDLTVQEVSPGGNRRVSITGGNNLHDLARSTVQHLSYFLSTVPNWYSTLGSRPSVEIETVEKRLAHKSKKFSVWNNKIRNSLTHNFNSERPPKAFGGAIASASTLVKDAEIIMNWLNVAKHIVAIDMEAAGVFAATRGKVPALVIRGISDIIGLRRAEDYNNYAASAAGALAVGLVQSGFFTFHRI